MKAKLDKYSINDVVTVRFRKSKDNISGILLKESLNWILLWHIPIDFQIDGFVLIPKKNISKVFCDEVERFKTEVIQKSKKLILDKSKQPFKNVELENIFEHFLKKKTLLQVESDNNDIAFIGKVIELNEEKISLKTLTVNGEWGDSLTLSKQKVWCVYSENDYTITLSKFLISNKKVGKTNTYNFRYTQERHSHSSKDEPKRSLSKKQVNDMNDSYVEAPFFRFCKISKVQNNFNRF